MTDPSIIIARLRLGLDQADVQALVHAWDEMEIWLSQLLAAPMLEVNPFGNLAIPEPETSPRPEPPRPAATAIAPSNPAPAPRPEVVPRMAARDRAMLPEVAQRFPSALRRTAEEQAPVVRAQTPSNSSARSPRPEVIPWAATRDRVALPEAGQRFPSALRRTAEEQAPVIRAETPSRPSVPHPLPPGPVAALQTATGSPRALLAELAAAVLGHGAGPAVRAAPAHSASADTPGLPARAAGADTSGRKSETGRAQQTAPTAKTTGPSQDGGEGVIAPSLAGGARGVQQPSSPRSEPRTNAAASAPASRKPPRSLADLAGVFADQQGLRLSGSVAAGEESPPPLPAQSATLAPTETPETADPATPMPTLPAVPPRLAPDPDPDLLAELVNEALVEQAERHGVDLA